MSERPRLVGINHVALEVDDVDAALAFYGSVFELQLRGRVPGTAFVDLGDQFLALSEPRTQPPDEHGHVGLVVDDAERTRRALEAAGADVRTGRGLRFCDPWGNQVEIVEYADVQFTKASHVLAGMGLGQLDKTAAALDELREKGLEPPGQER